MRRSRIGRPRERPWRTMEHVALAEFHDAVRARAEGWCEVRTPACDPGRHRGHEAHHVVRRSRAPRWAGLHEASNGLWCCSPGHAWITEHDREAKALGYSRSAPAPGRTTAV